ncbi:11959_t:CDS:2, partial [Dentiscutata erythropus]
DAENFLQRLARRFILPRHSRELIVRYPQAPRATARVTIRSTLPGTTIIETAKIPLATFVPATTVNKILITPTISQTTSSSPTDDPSQNPSNDTTSNTNFAPPISQNTSGDNSTTTKYVIIGVSVAVGIILIVSLLFIIRKLRSNSRLKHKNVNSGNSRGFDTGNTGNTGIGNALRNINHSSQQGMSSYKDASIQSYDATYGSGLYSTRSPYPVASDYSGRSGGSSPVDSNYYGYNGNTFQGYNYNGNTLQDPNFVTPNFLPAGGMDRRIIRDNVMEIANDENSTQENLRNYNTLSMPSERESEQESLRLSLINDNSRNSIMSSPGDNKSQTSQRPIYF